MSLTCDSYQPLTCEEGWFVEETFYRLPVCSQCKDWFPQSLTCD